MNNQTLSLVALEYAQRDLAVFPLHTIKDGHCTCGKADCSSPGKHPRTQAGFRDATTDLKQVNEWWETWPDSNIGIAAGPSHLVIIDIDPDDGGQICDLPLDDFDMQTLTVLTGKARLDELPESLIERGTHLYYRAPRGLDIGNSDTKLPQGINVRANGGYVVAPPSLHVTGLCYEWAEGKSPDDIRLLPLPAALLPLLKLKDESPPEASRPVRAAPPVDSDHPYVKTALQNELDDLARATEGNRNNALNKAAFTLGQFIEARLLDRIQIENLLLHTAMALGLAEAESRKTIKSGLDSGIATPRDNWPELTSNPRGSETPATPGSDKGGNGIDADQDPASDDSRPWVQINARHHREISEDVYNALLASNAPARVFVRSGFLTRIKLDEKRRPVAEDISPEILKFELDRAANCFTRRNGTNGDFIDTKTTVQMAVVKDVMAYPQWPELPPLAAIVQYPTFCPDGSLHAEPGYNPITQVYYYRNGLKLGDINPSVENVTWAKSIINDHLLEGFPFIDNASKTHAKAALLLPFVRHLIDGETPLHMFDAPTQGTGKGKLAKAVSYPTAPNGPALITPPDNDEEWRKSIVTILLQTPSHVLIDNIPETLESGTLAAVLTTRDYTARLLGTMKAVTVQNLPVWMGTGNNTSAHGELARRCVWSRIDAKMEKPWQRENFRHKDLEKWVKVNRGDIVTACLTLINLWFKCGCPMGEQPLGSFENWAAIMGGILRVIDADCDFLGNADTFYDRANEDRGPWLAFVEQWYEAYKHPQTNDTTTPVGTAELFSIASYYDSKDLVETPDSMNLLGEFIEQNNERARQIQLGRLLKKNVDRVYGKYQIIYTGEKNRLAQYKLTITT